MSENKASPVLIDIPELLPGLRIDLSRLRVEHAEAYLEALIESKEALDKWLPYYRHIITEDDARLHLTHYECAWLKREYLLWGLWDREANRFLGQISLEFPDWEMPKFEIGYWQRTAAAGHGFMTEAVEILTAFAFERLGAMRVAISCDPKNERSAGVARRCGYKLEGTLRNTMLNTEGKPRDTFLFGMTPEDYRDLTPNRYPPL